MSSTIEGAEAVFCAFLSSYCGGLNEARRLASPLSASGALT